MARVYISHTESDREIVQEVIRTLAAAGVETAQIDLEQDGPSKIRSAAAVILVASGASLSDPERLSRVRLAAGFAQPIFVALTQGIEPNDPRLGSIDHEQPLSHSDTELGSRVLKAIDGVDENSPRIFFSYSRKEADQAQAMVVALRARRLRVFQDVANLEPGVDWLKQLFEFIEEADSMVFAISPNSLASPVCAQEVAHAANTGTRILPLVLVDTPAEAIQGAPKELKQQNFVFANSEEKWRGAILEVEVWAVRDSSWHRNHAKLVREARAWAAGGGPNDRLLRGGVLQTAATLIENRPKDAPTTPAIVHEFINRSLSVEKEDQDRLYRGVANGFAVRAGQAIEEQRFSHAAKCVGAAAVLGDDLEFTSNRAAAAWRVGARALVNAAHIVLLGHADKVNDVCWSPSGDRVVTAGSDHISEIWDTNSGRSIHRLSNHSDAVKSARFSADGKYIVSAGADHTVRVWDAENGKEISRFDKHRARVNIAKFSPDGSMIASASEDTTIRIRDFATMREIACLSGHTKGVVDVVFSPDNQLIATSSQDGSARVWEIRAAKELAQPKVNSAISTSFIAASVRFSPDGSCIVTGSPTGEVLIWNPVNGEPVLLLRCHNDGVFHAEFSPDGKSFVTPNLFDRTAKVWDTRSGSLITTLSGHGLGVWRAAFSPEGDRIVTCSEDQTARVWDARTGIEISRLSGHGDGLSSAFFSPDGRRIATASRDGTARIWDAVGKAVLALYRFEDMAVIATDVDSGIERIVTSGKDKTTRLWDSSDGSLVSQIGTNEDWDSIICLSPSGQRLLTAKTGKTPILWSTDQGRLVQTIMKVGEWKGIALFSRDENSVLIETSDFQAHIFDLSYGRFRCALEGHDYEIADGTFSPDGLNVVTCGEGGQIAIWDAVNGKKKVDLIGHLDKVNKAAFSFEGDVVASASWDGTARIWNPNTGEELQRMYVGSREQAVDDIFFLPDGGRLATQSREGLVKFWDSGSGQEFSRLDIGKSLFKSAISPDGRRLVTANWNGPLRLWDIATSAEISCSEGEWTSVFDVKFTRCGERVVVTADAKSVWIWDLSKEIDAFTQASNGNPSVFVAAALANGVGRLTAAEGDDFLMKEAPTDIYAAMVEKMSVEQVKLVDCAAEILRRPRADNCYRTPSSWRPISI